ncbi:glycosyltransferase family 4 protein [Sphingomonas immobilis]|uniref:Glycosyltransferase family 4 protein n=1 Tax=Sphingomonas immobilis TaxID=3063997 RepID=A0ABT9A444_9SPHN|nr:glycosyltransferase family 4 protein [Sphingomonas sp. CA1-15]MDO7844613.1 glycosyltransferase family 4 protein [Sphingomonas sp. CA1-15]
MPIEDEPIADAPTLLIVARGAESYGVMTKLLSIIGELSQRGWRITIRAIGEGDFLERARIIPGVEIVPDPTAPRRFFVNGGKLIGYIRLMASSVAFVRGLRTFLKARRFSAAIFCEHGLVLPVAAAARGRGTPFFWLMPDVVSDAYPLDLNRRLYGAGFGWSGMIPVANSRYTRTTLGRAGKRAEQIDLGADPARYADAAVEPDPLAGVIPAGAVRVAVVARLEAEKGQRALVEAIAGAPELADVHLVICGGPAGSAYEQAIRDAAAAGGVAGRVHLMGPVAAPLGYYQSSDLVASVRSNVEPFGLSIVEAMLVGRPVLAHALGGPADIVVDGETGWLTQAASPEALRAGLIRALAERPRWAAMGAAGQARALERYTVASMTDQLLAVFARHGVKPGGS